MLATQVKFTRMWWAARPKLQAKWSKIQMWVALVGVNMRLGNIAINGHEVAGRDMGELGWQTDIKRDVTVKGKVSEGFGNYAAVCTALNWWTGSGNPDDVARRVRDWFADKIRLMPTAAGEFRGWDTCWGKARVAARTAGCTGGDGAYPWWWWRWFIT